MISLKLDHSHSHHLPCHPTRSYIEEQASISETDREQLTDEEDENKNQYGSLQEVQHNQFKIIDSRVNNDPIESVEIIPLKKKKKPVSKLTPEEIYQANVIDESFQGSLKGLPSNIREMIMQKQKLVEDKIYLGISQKGSQLLERMYQEIDTKTHLKDCIQENLNDMMSDIQSQFESDILTGDRYVIHKIIRSTKNDIINNRKRKLVEQLTFNSSITAHNATSKDDSQSYVTQSHNQHPTQQDFSLKSEKTRKADQFIKKIQEEQHEQRKRRKEQAERKKSLEVRSLEEKRQFEEQIKSERRNYLKRRIQAKKQIKSKELEIRQKMNKQYKEFLKKYKNRTPLFKEKQQMFNKMQDEERKKQEDALEKRRQQRRSINIEDIRQHEKKYQQFRSEKQIQKSHQKKLSTIETSNVQYFKGRYHDILAEEDEKEKQRQIKQDPKLIRSQLLKKRDIYAKEVRKNYLPKSDEAKQKQLQQLIQKLQWTQKLKEGKLDIKERNIAGNEYLRRLHELIAELREKNKLPHINKTIDYEELEKSTRPQYKNYLEELRASRRKYSVDYSRIADVDLEDAHFRVKKLEQKAKRRQAYVEGKNFNIDRTLEQRKKIDDDYLQSVKAKMALLNKFD